MYIEFNLPVIHQLCAHTFPFISDTDSDFFKKATLTFSHEQEDDEDTQQSRAEQETTSEQILLVLSWNVAEVCVCLCVCVFGSPTLRMSQCDSSSRPSDAIATAYA